MGVGMPIEEQARHAADDDNNVRTARNDVPPVGFMGGLLQAQFEFIKAQHDFLNTADSAALLRAQHTFINHQANAMQILGIFG